MSISPVVRPISPLRQRMLEDMAVRGLRADTQHDYIRFVRSFAAFLGRPPDTATAEDVCVASKFTKPRAACSRRRSIAQSQPSASSSA